MFLVSEPHQQALCASRHSPLSLSPQRSPALLPAGAATAQSAAKAAPRAPPAQVKPKATQARVSSGSGEAHPSTCHAQMEPCRASFAQCSCLMETCPSVSFARVRCNGQALPPAVPYCTGSALHSSPPEPGEAVCSHAPALPLDCAGALASARTSRTDRTPVSTPTSHTVARTAGECSDPPLCAPHQLCRSSLQQRALSSALLPPRRAPTRACLTCNHPTWPCHSTAQARPPLSGHRPHEPLHLALHRASQPPPTPRAALPPALPVSAVTSPCGSELL